VLHEAEALVFLVFHHDLACVVDLALNLERKDLGDVELRVRALVIQHWQVLCLGLEVGDGLLLEAYLALQGFYDRFLLVEEAFDLVVLELHVFHLFADLHHLGAGLRV